MVALSEALDAVKHTKQDPETCLTLSGLIAIILQTIARQADKKGSTTDAVELAITVLEKIARLRELSGDSSMDKAETMVLTELIKVGFGALTAYTKLFDDSGCMRAGLNLQEQLPCIVSCHKMKVKFLALPIVSGKGVVLQGSANASHAKDISDSIKAHLESLNASFQKALDTITQDLAQATP